MHSHLLPPAVVQNIDNGQFLINILAVPRTLGTIDFVLLEINGILYNFVLFLRFAEQKHHTDIVWTEMAIRGFVFIKGVKYIALM